VDWIGSGQQNTDAVQLWYNRLAILKEEQFSEGAAWLAAGPADHVKTGTAVALCDPVRRLRPFRVT